MRTIVRAIVTAAILLFSIVPSFAQQVAKTIPNSSSPEGLIGFLQFTPPDYGSQKHPLIIFLHGIGERGNGTSQINSVAANGTPYYCSRGASMRFTVNGKTSSFVVLSPQLSTQLGYWPTFYVKEMINYAKANLQIDPNRIYVTGLSLGGGGVWRLITDVYNSDYTYDGGIAAVAPVCGTQEETDANFCSTIGANHLPIWAFHCMDDGTVGVGATQHAEILSKNCGITPAAKFTYYQSGNHGGAWTNAYDTGHITRTLSDGSNFTANPNLYEWFLSNTRGTTLPVTQTNTPPTANAGGAQTIALPTSSVTLSGSGAGTNGASVASYAWTKTGGPSTANFSNAAAASTSVSGLTQGTYTLTLKVTDNHGLTSSSNTTVTVNSAPVTNKLPVASPGGDYSITLPNNSITLNGMGSYDPDGSITSYKWTQTAGPTTASMNSTTQNLVYAWDLVTGTYSFKLTVTDNAGGSSSTTVNITVQSGSGNKSPVASPGGDYSITLPSNSITLNGIGSYDPDGSITSFKWTQTGGPSTASMNSTTQNLVYAWDLIAGVYSFKLTVTDNAGTSSAATVNITVQSPGSGNKAPVSSPGGDYSITLPSNSITLNGMGSYDADGSIASYRWTQTAGPSTASMNSTTQNMVYAWDLVAGVYTFNLTVTDNKGATGSASLNITVKGKSSSGNLLGYVKMSVGPYQACDDASSSGRIAVYGTTIANSGILYKDAAMTQPYDGGWNWFSFTPVLGGATTYAFAIYPNGSIALLRNCATGAAARVAVTNTTTAEEDIATLKRLKDSAATAATTIQAGTNKLSMYPNPVRSNATIELNSDNDGVKIINVFSADGVLKGKYSWQTVKGHNSYSLKEVSGFANGLYIIDIRDYTGKSVGSLKFLKM